MDSKEEDLGDTGRSFPTVYNALFVGHVNNVVATESSDDNTTAILRLREGTGGVFANSIIVNVADNGTAVYRDQCAGEVETQTFSNVNTASATRLDFLFFSGNNIISTGGGSGTQFDPQSPCPAVFGAIDTDPLLVMQSQTPSQTLSLIHISEPTRLDVI
eukprot:2022534-Prorocentrum_lima.AAC.1